MIAVAVLGYKVFDTRMNQKPKKEDVQRMVDEIKKQQWKEDLDQDGD